LACNIATAKKRTKGPVAAIAAAPGDTSICAVAAVAIAAKEELIIVEAYESAADTIALREFASDTGLTVTHVAVGRIPRSDPASLVGAIRQFQERCIVTTRDVLANGIAVSGCGIATRSRAGHLNLGEGTMFVGVPNQRALDPDVCLRARSVHRGMMIPYRRSHITIPGSSGARPPAQ
jgi:hypothetical protein